MLLLGDQVYADEVSPQTLAYIRSHRDTTKPPHEGIANFEEYTQLYREAWGEPADPLAALDRAPAMIFDDHDVIDDWNTSLEWLEEMRATDWWDERVVGGFMSYVLYQHWGNLSPDALEEEEIYQRVRRTPATAAAAARLRLQGDREVEGARWSYCRDIGLRARRDDRLPRRPRAHAGRARMVDEGEWEWISEHATGGVDHLLIGTSLPLFLGPALHYLEAWNEAVCDGAWGRPAAKLGEKLRQGARPRALAGVPQVVRPHVRAAAGGRRRASAVSRRARLSCFQATFIMRTSRKSAFPTGSGVRSRVWQATCSPFRNPLDTNERRADPRRPLAPAERDRPRPGALCGRSRAAGALAAPARRALVRQPSWRRLNSMGAMRRLASSVRSRPDRGHAHPTLEIADEYGSARWPSRNLIFARA